MTDDCTGLRASLDAAERRIEELESQLSIATGALELRRQLEEAEKERDQAQLRTAIYWRWSRHWKAVAKKCGRLFLFEHECHKHRNEQWQAAEARLAIAKEALKAIAAWDADVSAKKAREALREIEKPTAPSAERHGTMSFERLEIRISELESALSIATGALYGCRTDCSAAVARVEEGRLLFADLYKRHWIQGEDHDRQLADMTLWARVDAETGETC